MRIEIAGVALLLLSAVTAPATARGARIDLAPTQADPGGTAEICAFLSGNSHAVALQMDLQWDSRCVAPVLTGSGTPQCSASSATGKNLVAALLDQRTRIIMLALGAQTTIPNGQIFCCTFNVSQIPPSATCPFAFAGISGSDGNGTRLANFAAQGTALAIRQSDDRADQPQPGAAAPPVAPGIAIPSANQPGNPAAAPTAVKNQPAPTTINPGYVASRVTPGQEGVVGVPAAERAEGEPPVEEHTPVVDKAPNTPRTTATATTPTARVEATRTAPPATQTITRAATPAGTPTPSK